MSSLRLTGSLPSSSVAPANNAGLAQGGIADATSFFSSLLDQLHGGVSGNAGQQGLSAALSGALANSSPHAGTSLQEMGTSWKSFLTTWSSKLKSYNSSSSASSPASQQGPVTHKCGSSAAVASNNNGLDQPPAKTASGSSAGVQNRAAKDSSNDDSPGAGQATNCSTSNAAANQVSACSESDNDATDDASSATQTEDSVSDALRDLFAELQALMAQLQQRLQSANGTSDISSCDEDATSGSEEDDSSSKAISDEPTLVTVNQGNDGLSELLDPNSQASDTQADGGSVSGQDNQITDDARDMLQDLLSLAKTLDDRLGLSRDAGERASSDSLPFEQLGRQLSRDLKSVTDSLRAYLSSSGQPAIARHAASSQSNIFDQADAPSDADTSNSSNATDAAADLAAKALTTAEHMVAQLSNLSQMASDAAQTQAKSAAAPTFSSFDAAHSLFADSHSADGGNLNSNSFEQQSGSSSGNLSSGAAGNAAVPTGAEGIKGSNPYSFANQLASLRSASSGLTTLSSPTEQVIVHLHRALASGDNRLSIQLNPTDLGRIDIKLDMASDGKVQGTVVVSNPSTLDMLQKDARGLERALQEAGLQADPGSLNFSLGGQQQDGSSRQAAQNGGFGSSGSVRSISSSQDDNGTQPDIPEVSETWVVSPNRVNVRI